MLHLDISERLQSHVRSGNLDFSGTRFTPELLRWALDAADRRFERVSFNRAEFTQDADFHDVTFGQAADFAYAHFHGEVTFQNASFGGAARFVATRFDRHARFRGVRFEDRVTFAGAEVADHLRLEGAHFESDARLGPLIADVVELGGARFVDHLEIVAEARLVRAKRTRFEGVAVIRLHAATLVLEGATFGASASLAGMDQPLFPTRQDLFHHVRTWPALASLRDSDVGDLVITDVDLAWCQFAGARRLDQLRIEGRCPLNRPPSGWRWTSREVLAEEHFWRSHRHYGSGWCSEHPLLEEKTSEISPVRLAALYRSLRKAFEDSKYEAGAGDFYYGEMEARRHSAITSRAERWILAMYWLLSGYGQRAARALAGLLVLLVVVTGLLVGFGLPQPAPQQIVQSGQTLTVVEPPAVLPPAGQRVTAARVEKAVQITLGAMVFRDAGQKLTSAGTWILMVARIGGPLLLALAILAVRARVKR